MIKEFTHLYKEGVCLVAVSKTRTEKQILELYNEFGVFDFGENRVQELLEKYDNLPKNIRWHMIGHLQRNKVKQILPFVYLIQSVDNVNLLETIQNEAKKISKKISILLQIKICEEDTKYGLSFNKADNILLEYKKYPNVLIKGFMGIGTLGKDEKGLRDEFTSLYKFYLSKKEEYDLKILSMGMSSDYKIAISSGSNMVRLGTVLFSK